MAVRFGQATALAIATVLLTGAALGAARQPEHGINKVHDKLLTLSPPERAATLARVVGHWCVGTEAFPMGIVTAGNGEGNAYWSLRCADGSAWAVQIDPLAQVTAIDCEVFKENGAGKECFKKF
jgi:hypothetical protein